MNIGSDHLGYRLLHGMSSATAVGPPRYIAKARIRRRRPGLQFSRETADLIVLNRIAGGARILPGSALASGGRMRHQLQHNLWRANASGHDQFSAPHTILVHGKPGNQFWKNLAFLRLKTP